jgi:molybdopterin molybdotransferase
MAPNVNDTAISAAEAWARLAPWLLPGGTDLMPRRASLGRILATEARASVDVPGSDVSAMDGFALRGPLAAGEHRRVLGLIAAGDRPGVSLPDAASCWRIMTGAPLPDGADRVVPVERSGGFAAAQRDGTVVLTAAAEAGDHIRRRGEIVRQGEPLLAAGQLLTPGALALLATHGHAELAVVRPPRVAILTTGDEVVPPEAQPLPGQLRDSHTDFLLAACQGVGLSATSFGIAPDAFDALRERVAAGLAASDVLLLCGGVSMGELDLVEEVLGGLGCERLFAGVAIQPGKPLVVAVRQRPGQAAQVIFGLPGNPGSVMTCFWLFVRPALHCLLGHRDGYWLGALRGRLTAPVPGAGPRDRFAPASLAIVGGELQVRPRMPRGSHDLIAFAADEALVRMPAGSPPSPAGAPCEVLPLLAKWGQALYAFAP